MALWKRNKRYWTRFVVNGVKFRKPLRSPGQSRATTNWKEAVQLERDVIEQARNGALTPKAGPSRLFAACDAYLAAKRATANRERTVAFDEERLAIVKDRIGDVLLRPSPERGPGGRLPPPITASRPLAARTALLGA